MRWGWEFIKEHRAGPLLPPHNKKKEDKGRGGEKAEGDMAPSSTLSDP